LNKKFDEKIESLSIS